LFGKEEKTEQLPRFTPQQEQTTGQLLGGAQEQLPQIFQYLQQILSQSPEMMQQFQAPAMRQFEEEIIPTIAERFSKVNAQKSSAFGQQLGKAGAGLAENLAAQRAGLGQNAISQLQQLLGQGMQPQFETMFRPGTSGSLAQLLGPLLGGIGGGAAQLGTLWAGKKLGLGG